MKIIAETERLILREFTILDAENFYLLNLDYEVIKFTGDLAFESIESAKLFIENYDHYKKYGFGRWAVINKINGEFLGWCGLKYSPESNEFDIGFRFFQINWSNGYASEAALACIKIGFNKFKIKSIIRKAMKENKASVKVLQKIGLTYFEERKCDDKQLVIYKIENQ